ncbi:MAG: amidohydrolase [Candidatus Bathyarchaeia archaeon]
MDALDRCKPFNTTAYYFSPMPHADLVLINGNIVTMNPGQPKAHAAAIRDGRLVAVGTNTQVLAYADKSTQKMDLKGKTVIPGFIDTHVHGASLGRSLSHISLRGAKSIEEIKEKVRQRAKETPEGKWIRGGGWDQDRLVEHRYPTRLDLDQASPDHPVLLTRVCGHLAVVNSEALKQAGITKGTEAPKGGCIDRDSSGLPNGVLRENALDLIFSVLPKPSDEDVANTCLLACQVMVGEGITTAHWIVGSASELRALQMLRESNMLPLRVYVLIPVECLDNLAELGLSTGFGDDRLRVGSIKILLDGSLGGRTAALKHPYNDAPNTSGMLLYSMRQLEKFVAKAHEADLQLAIHAIGDKAVETALKALEKAVRKAPKEDNRHRLEHASVLNPKLIRMMRDIGVVASVQPHFIVSDFWMTNRLGKARTRWTYAFKSLIKAGVKVIAGSDAPVEPVSPILGVYASVARKTNCQEKLTIDEALKLYTVNAAYSSFEEGLKGSIEVGKLADLVVLSRDPYKTATEKLRDVKVGMTIVGGTVVYARKQ